MDTRDDRETETRTNVGGPTERLPYEPPEAKFVPLKMEERVLICSKDTSPCFSGNIGAS